MAATADELRDRAASSRSPRVAGRLEAAAPAEQRRPRPIRLDGHGNASQGRARRDRRRRRRRRRLGVMSQGELHSLALSLFLPRATVDESPFRFVLIDDPVQAWTRRRSTGWRRVLSRWRRRPPGRGLHPRRPARRGRPPAQDRRHVIWEVQRRRAVGRRDPSERRTRWRALPRGRARTRARPTACPADVRGRAACATCCRSAIEAACHVADPPQPARPRRRHTRSSRTRSTAAHTTTPAGDARPVRRHE